MNELADELLLSRGGAMRLVARMEEAGLVRREIPPEDRRATYAVLTDAGREAIERAIPIHLDTVHEVFGRHITHEEAEQLIALASRILTANGLPADRLSGSPEPEHVHG